MKKEKVVLAFSGGLDTSYCALYLSKVKNLEVHAVTVNTGGFSAEDVTKIEQQAVALGVTSFKLINETRQFYDKVLKYLIFGNVLKNNTYPLSVSAERIAQAVAVANYAKLIGANHVAHGSTGAGNDQVRFDLVFNILIPGIKILTPIRDSKLSREQEIKFLQEHGVAVNAQKAAYSINKGIWGTSVGGKETLTSNTYLPEDAWPTQISKTGSETLDLHFKGGELKGINTIKFGHPTEAISYLNNLAAPYGIGRDIHVGDTIIGIKGRVGFEAAAPLIIIKSHHTLEKHVLTKWQAYWKDQLALWYGNWLHEGQYLDPVMRNIEAFMSETQTTVNGKVNVTLMPHRFIINGIESPHDLMSSHFGTYGEENKSWSGEDVKGFTRIFGNQTAIYHQVNQNTYEYK
jgi:argininosuccinate synthase